MNYSAKAISGAALLCLSTISCTKQEDPESYLLGSWNLTEYAYTADGVTHTTVYESGEKVYQFLKDNRLEILSSGEATQYKTWKVRGTDYDSLVFNTGEPWDITDKTDNSFNARFIPS